MMIRNKKMFIRGILFVLLGAAIAGVRFLIFSHNVHGLLKPILIEASMMCGAVLAGADKEETALVEKAASDIGLAFQSESGEEEEEE